MSRTIYILHGTEGHPKENWFPWLKEKLEAKDCEVIVPQFPSPPIVPAKIDEWYAVFDQYLKNIDQDTIIVGHSLGGDFLLRLLERFDTKILAAAFVGTPVGVKPILNYDRDSAFCGFNFDWEKIRQAAQEFIVFQSDDDPYVSLGNGEELAKKLGVELTFIPNAGHFNKKAGYIQFNELYEKLTTLL